MTMDEPTRVRTIYERLIHTRNAQHWEPTSLSHFEGQPYKALIAAMLSAQTREEHTTAAMHNLLALAETPAAMAQLTDDQIRTAIRPVMYFESKVRYVRDIAERVAANGGVVPRTLDELMAYKGVGWKVAVLTLAVGYGIYDNITVDVHVARIGIRLGLVRPTTQQPPKVNEALKRVLPRDLWPYWNPLMVMFGRAVCLPTHPRCKVCPLNDLCPKVGVDSAAG